MLKVLDLRTNAQVEFIDITHRIVQIVRNTRIKSGICIIFVPHTTAGIIINENADPSVKADLVTELDRLLPQRPYFKHSEGNSPAHIKSALCGQSVTAIVENNNLLLGTWQGIYFCEFDGPRMRRIFVKVTATPDFDAR
jgi:secondary thiamine-phosphate synthase enzyme